MIASAPYRPAARGHTALIGWLCLAVATVAANLLNQASLDFSFLSGLFVLTTYMTVTACGGLQNFFGATLAFVAFQHVIAACFLKLILGQPIEDRLDTPITTMEIYCVGMTSMAIGAYVGSRIAAGYKKVLFPPVENTKLLRAMAWVGFFGSIARIVIFHSRFASLASGSTENAGLVSVIISMEFLPLLAVACATAACVLESKGKRCFDLTVFIMILPGLLSGAVSAGRGEMVFAVAVAFFTALAFGFRFRPIHIVTAVALGYIAVYILFPYGRYARQYVRGADIGTNIRTAITILEDVIVNPGKYQDPEFTSQEKFIESRAVSNMHHHWEFFVPNNDSFARFGNIKATDAIVFNGLQHQPLGWQTTMDGLLMATPSMFVTDKPIFADNNMIGHLVPQYLGPKDFVTQPNTGIFADTFLSFRWLGVAIYPAVLVFLYHITYGYMLRLRLARNVFALAILPRVVSDLSEGSVAIQMQALTIFLIYTVVGFGVVRGMAAILDIDKFPNMLRIRSIRERKDADAGVGIEAELPPAGA